VGQASLVETQINDGQRLVEELVRDGFDVAAAFWLKAYDSDWYLYVVSPVVEAEGIANAYRRVNAVLRRMPAPFRVDPFDVKLVGPADKLAQAVLNAQRRSPSKTPVRSGGASLGDLSVEEAYLYPLPAAVNP
jgi:hypothetical protein